MDFVPPESCLREEDGGMDFDCILLFPVWTILCPFLLFPWKVRCRVSRTRSFVDRTVPHSWDSLRLWDSLCYSTIVRPLVYVKFLVNVGLSDWSLPVSSDGWRNMTSFHSQVGISPRPGPSGPSHRVTDSRLDIGQELVYLLLPPSESGSGLSSEWRENERQFKGLVSNLLSETPCGSTQVR